MVSWAMWIVMLEKWSDSLKVEKQNFQKIRRIMFKKTLVKYKDLAVAHALEEWGYF